MAFLDSSQPRTGRIHGSCNFHKRQQQQQQQRGTNAFHHFDRRKRIASPRTNFCVSTVPPLRMMQPSDVVMDPNTLTMDSISSTTTTLTPQTSFEPVLNVPALGVFLFIAVVFGFLQYRIAAIGQAADRRTQALETLRDLKARQLAGMIQNDNDNDENSNDSVRNTATAAEATVQNALQDYERALVRVEELRTIVPGLVRIPPPPAESASRERLQENMAAAQQFGLNVTLLTSSWPPADEAPPSITKEGGGRTELPEWMTAILVVLAISQLLVLWLFTVDSSSMGNVMFVWDPSLSCGIPASLPVMEVTLPSGSLPQPYL